MNPRYKFKCDDCRSSGEETHAKLFYRKINKQFMYLCSQCWEAHRSEPNYFAKVQTFSLERTQSEYNGTYEV